MIEWNFNMDEAPRDKSRFLLYSTYWKLYAIGVFGAYTSGWDKNTETLIIPKKFHIMAENGVGDFFDDASRDGYFTAWARINPPVKGE